MLGNQASQEDSKPKPQISSLNPGRFLLLRKVQDPHPYVWATGNGSGFRVQGLGFLGFRVLGFRVLGFRV